MSHLIEEYAKCCGVQIGKPVISEHYYPIPYEKYITIHCDTKDKARQYEHWGIVVSILKSEFEKQDIKIVQIGAPDGVEVEGVDLNLCGVSFKQSFHLLRHAELHLGIDSYPVHVASSYGKKIVSLYSNLWKECSRPYWSKDEDVRLMEPDFSKTKPSFSAVEAEPRINEHKPEDICSAVCDLLGLKMKTDFKSIYYGKSYKSKIVDLIPTSVPSPLPTSLNVRMDKYFNLDVLSYILERQSVEITTDKPIPAEFLVKNRIKVVNYISDSLDEDFVKLLKKEGINNILLCSSEKNLKEQRYKFFDYNIYLFDEKKIIKRNKKRLKKKDLKDFKVNSARKIIKGDKIYSSYYEISKKKKDLYLDLNWLMIYNSLQHG